MWARGTAHFGWIVISAHSVIVGGMVFPSHHIYIHTYAIANGYVRLCVLHLQGRADVQFLYVLKGLPTSCHRRQRSVCHIPKGCKDIYHTSLLAVVGHFLDDGWPSL